MDDPTSPPTKILCHQFSLRQGYLAQVVIPADLTKAEADRLCSFVASLATPQGANHDDQS